jgi:hypothetical protein
VKINWKNISFFFVFFAVRKTDDKIMINGLKIGRKMCAGNSGKIFVLGNSKKNHPGKSIFEYS